ADAYRAIIRQHRRRLGAADDSISVVILLRDLEQATADRIPVLPLASELVRLGASVTVLLMPGGRITTAVQADQWLADHLLEPLFAVQVGGDIPCCDVLVATDACSASRAQEFAHRAGRVVYFVQDHEPAFRPATEQPFWQS